MATVRELFSREDYRRIVIFQTDGDELELLKDFGITDVYREAEKSRATIYSVIPGVRLLGLSPAEQKEGARRFYDYWLAVSASIVLPKRAKKYRDHFAESFLQNASIWLGRQAAMDGAARITGGFTSFLEHPTQAGAIYARILADVNSRYVIGYYPTNKTRDGKRRKVSIEIRNHPEYSVEGRKTYFAPEPEP
jgi:hypothetical protein